MSHLGNVFANTYDKEVFLDKEERKNTDFGRCNKVPHGDWKIFDKNLMLQTMNEIMNTIKKRNNESENNTDDKAESILTVSSVLQNQSRKFSKYID